MTRELRVYPVVGAGVLGVACLVVLAWWGVSYRGVAGAMGSVGQGRWEISGDHGAVTLVWFESWEGETPLEFYVMRGGAGGAVAAAWGPAGPGWATAAQTGRLGFAYSRGTYVGPSWWAQRRVPFVRAGVPHVLLVVLLGVWPTVVGRGLWQRWRWSRTGRCVGCGYDLRGTRGECPECGMMRG